MSVGSFFQKDARGVSCNRQVGAALLLVGPVERVPRVSPVLVEGQLPLRKTSARKAPCERERERERARRGNFGDPLLTRFF